MYFLSHVTILPFCFSETLLRIAVHEFVGAAYVLGWLSGRCRRRLGCLAGWLMSSILQPVVDNKKKKIN
jgi:hypothetical protein